MHDAEFASETLEETRGGPRARAQLALPHLFLVVECARPYAGGSRHDLAQIDEIAIGRGARRSAARSLVGGRRVLEVRVPDARMSQRHARIVRSDRGFVFEDLGSTNGSRVGQTPAVGPRLLADGDVLEVGRTFFRLRAALPTSPGSPADVDATGLSDGAPGPRTLLPALADTHAALEKVAASHVPVLLLGETGTGKEVLAKAIHRASGRSGPFVAVNCGAIPPNLVEAQLFGHTRGAFSGATRDELGFVRSAHGGTLFLDEIGDLPKGAQAALLRVLQEKEVVPVGSAQPRAVDLRVVSATHHNLEASVGRGDFRADLYARLSGLTHELLPLRDRIEDLGLLVSALLPSIVPDRAQSVSFTPALCRRLLEHGWPLNIRELQSTLSVAAILAGDHPIDVEHLTRGSTPPPPASAPDLDAHDDEALRAHLVDALSQTGGNVAEVARVMGKARMQVHRWMKRFNIDPKTFRST
jgi:transcriptional regulator of acetoin/glycerol metabolism